MNWMAEWMPMIVTAIAWVIFFLFMNRFKGARFLKQQEEHTRLLKHHSTLLERIALALEVGKRP
jgi:hypothetical protein